nr:hypothetical protein [Anaerolineaceae bacterium]
FGAAGGVVSGQYVRMTSNLILGKDLTEGMFQKDMLLDAALGGLGGAVGYGLAKLKESNFILFNKTHVGSAPSPKGVGPNGSRLQSHHPLQQEWAINNLVEYGYDRNLAPTVTIETGTGYPHTNITNSQIQRRNLRVASGNGKWNSSLQDELQYIVDDFIEAGFSKSTIKKVLEQQYKMLKELAVPFERINVK